MDKTIKTYDEIFLIEDKEKARHGETWIRLMKKLLSAKDMLDIATGVVVFPQNPERVRAVIAGLPLVDAGGVVLPGLVEDGNPPPPPMVAAGAAAADRAIYTFEYQRYREEVVDLKEARKEWSSTSKKGKVLINKYIGENILGRISQNNLANLPRLWTAITVYLRDLSPHERHHLDSLYRSPIRQQPLQDILKYVAMLKDIECTIEVGSVINPTIKKSILLKGLLSKFKDIIRVMHVSHGMDRDACVLLLIEEEHRLDGIEVESKEDSVSGSSKDKIRKLEEQVEKLTKLLNSTSDKRVQKGDKRDTEEEEEEEEKEEEEEEDLIKEKDIAEDEAGRLGLLNRVRSGIKFELKPEEEDESTSDSSDDSTDY